MCKFLLTRCPLHRNNSFIISYLPAFVNTFFERFLCFFQNFLFTSLFCTVSRRQLYHITTSLPFCQHLFSSFFDLCLFFFFIHYILLSDQALLYNCLSKLPYPYSSLKSSYTPGFDASIKNTYESDVASPICISEGNLTFVRIPIVPCTSDPVIGSFPYTTYVYS